jgi:plastocyanin
VLTVVIEYNGFNPATITAHVGECVTWVNGTGQNLTIHSNDATWGSRVMRPQQTFEHAFTLPGSYTYKDNHEPPHVGTVLVT